MVYGPWGRPDMAPFIFTKNIIEGREITIYNYGNLQRDFTYVDDIIEGLFMVIDKEPKKKYDYNIYNLGASNPINLNKFIKIIEKKLNKKAIIKYASLREGDVYKTYASVTKLKEDFNYSPKVNIEDGIECFLKWYLNYFGKVNHF